MDQNPDLNMTTTVAEINTVCFVGAGTMGCFNALMAAVAGYRAVLHDVDAGVLDSVPATLEGMAGFLVGQGMCNVDDIAPALERVAVESNLQLALAEANLVSESVSERLEIKRQVHQSLDTLCRPDTLITTNTSSLLVSDIEDVLIRGDRFAALHSHLGSRLIDIVPGPRTTGQVVDILERYVTSIAGVPLVLKKENPGYVVNAMIGPFLSMGLVLVIEQRGSFEDVDRAWMRKHGAPCGPFGLMDLFGINVIHDSWLKPSPGREELRAKVIRFLSPYIENEQLGAKTGQGFYSYPIPSYTTEESLQIENHALLGDALLCALISSAIILASNGIAEQEEIDRAWTVSFSLPKGPFAALEEIGIQCFMSMRGNLVADGLLSDEFTPQIAEYLMRANVTSQNAGCLDLLSGPA